MARLDELILGYRVVKVREDYLPRLLSLSLKVGAPLTVTHSGEVHIPLRSYRRLSPLLDSNAVLSVSEPMGALGRLTLIPKHIPSLVALILSLLLTLYLGGLVSDVRVTGNESMSEAEVLALLSDAGLSVGSRWSTLDKDGVELSVLESGKLGWISINRQGSAALVSVIEREDAPPPEDSGSPANIVAAFDCVIESITVTSGTPVVGVGDTVHRGDLLISGVVESDSGTSYVRAAGSVIGRTSASITTEMGRTAVESLDTDRGAAYLTLKIYNFSINILNNYGKVPNGCVIIDDVKECTLASRRLPIAILTGRFAEKSEQCHRLTDTELVGITAERHRADVAAALAESDLIRIETSGRFTADGYEMTSLAVYAAEVTRVQPINTEK